MYPKRLSRRSMPRGSDCLPQNTQGFLDDFFKLLQGQCESQMALHGRLVSVRCEYLFRRTDRTSLPGLLRCSHLANFVSGLLKPDRLPGVSVQTIVGPPASHVSRSLFVLLVGERNQNPLWVFLQSISFSCHNSLDVYTVNECLINPPGDHPFGSHLIFNFFGEYTAGYSVLTTVVIVVE